MVRSDTGSLKASIIAVVVLVIIGVIGAVFLQVGVVNKVEDTYKKDSMTFGLWYGSNGFMLALLQLVVMVLLIIILIVVAYRLPYASREFKSNISVFQDEAKRFVDVVRDGLKNLNDTALTLGNKVTSIEKIGEGIGTGMSKLFNVGKSILNLDELGKSASGRGK
jgi:preprotein translocase subunit SecG